MAPLILFKARCQATGLMAMVPSLLVFARAAHDALVGMGISGVLLDLDLFRLE
jgi:hypothetical protein